MTVVWLLVGVVAVAVAVAAAAPRRGRHRSLGRRVFWSSVAGTGVRAIR